MNASVSGGRADLGRRILLLALVGGTSLRVLAGVTFGLGIDEQYAIAVARDFQWSFLDHPPLGFWMGTLSWNLFESTHPLLVRLPFILLAILTTLLLYVFTARLFGREAGGWAALLFNLSPLFSIVAGSWLMPDGPLLAAALGSACCLLPIIEETPGRRIGFGRGLVLWCGAGVLLGLALLAKYLAVFYAFGVVLFVASMPTARRWFVHPGPYLGCLLGLLVFSPVLIWNLNHDWASFAFQGGRAAADGGLEPGYVLQMVFGAALYLAPWLWWPLLAEGVKAVRSGRSERGLWFCLCIAVPTILALTIIPLWGKRGLPHWPAVGFLFLLPVLGRATAMALVGPPAGRRLVTGWLWFSGGAFPVVLLVMIGHAQFGWGTGLIPEENRAKDPTLDMLSWDPVESLLRDADIEPGDEVVVAALHWMEGGRVGAALGDDWPVVVADRNAHHFPYLHPDEDWIGHDVVFVGTPDRLARVEGWRDHFESMAPLGEIELVRAGAAVMTVGAVRGVDLRRPLPPMIDQSTGR